MKEYDVIVIGAGASGLMAACELSKSGQKVAIVEACDQTGGRIKSVKPEKFTYPIEAGAEFVHGNLPLTLELLTRYNIAYNTVKGEMWRTQDGQLTADSQYITGFELLDKRLNELRKDISVEEFLNNYFKGEKYEQLRTAVRKFTEGFDTADINRASTFKFREEWMAFEKEREQYRIDGGYTKLIVALEEECKKMGCEIFLSYPVVEVRWVRDYVQVVDAEQHFFKAAKLIITVSPGVLLAEPFAEGAIHFVPPILEKKKALQQLGFGAAIKIILQFNKPFWTTGKFEAETGLPLKNVGFLFSDAPIPTWWTQLPDESSILTGWIGGPAAKQLKGLEKEAVLKIALDSIASIFNEKEKMLARQLVAWYLEDWQNNPFVRGSYSYNTVETEHALKLVRQPIDNTIYFAGEATYNGPSTGTVEAALVSGINVATQILEGFLMESAA